MLKKLKQKIPEEADFILDLQREINIKLEKQGKKWFGKRIEDKAIEKK